MEPSEKRSKGAQEGESKKARKTADSPEKCPACMTVFDDKVQRPHFLPCSHIVCTICVNKCKRQGSVDCPECRVSHAVPGEGQFPVCHTLEALIRKMRAPVLAAAASLPPSAGTVKRTAAAAGQKEAAGLPRNMRSFLKEQETSVRATITAGKEVQAQLHQYQTSLKGWCEQQQKLEDMLQDLLDLSKRARELVLQGESRTTAKKAEARDEERKLDAALEALGTPATYGEAHLAVAKVSCSTFEAKEVFKECYESFPDTKTATTVRKVRKAYQAVVEEFKDALKKDHFVSAGKSISQSETYCPIMDKLCATVLSSLKAEDFSTPIGPVRRLLEAGCVFGVHQVEGQSRHARISLEANQVYLHTLKEGPPPPDALHVKVSKVVPSSPPCKVFLDLSWKSNAPRRILIRLDHDTPHGRRMVLLCTGQSGPSYAGTDSFKIEDGGEPGERVLFKDYEINDEDGGEELQPGYCEYEESGKVGDVCGYEFGDTCASDALFGIITRKMKRGDEDDCVFGKVVQGIDFLVEQAEWNSFDGVSIVDCGVLL